MPSHCLLRFGFFGAEADWVTSLPLCQGYYVDIVTVPCHVVPLGLSQGGPNCRHCSFSGVEILDRCVNDPSAGSPTETLLRLHLPLSDKV